MSIVAKRLDASGYHLVVGTKVGLGPGDIVLDWEPAGAQPPSQLSAHVRCGQTAEWIKMPLGIQVGLGTGDFVLDGDPAPMSIVAKRTPISATAELLLVIFAARSERQ